MDTHEGRTAEEDGHEVLDTLRHGVKARTVLIRKMHRDEWDFEIVDGEGVESREDYDDGSVQLTPQQMEKKLRLLGDRFQDALNVNALDEAEFA